MANLVKISDSTSTTSSVVAASSTAVKAAMDKANSAATAASNAQTTADSKLSSITAGTGIAVSGSTVSLDTVVTANNGGPTANATLSYGGTFTVPYFTYDAYGRITGRTNRTMTMPAAPSVTTITGNAGTATKLATARTITIPAAMIKYNRSTATISFDGSANKTFACTTCSTSCSGNCTGGCGGCSGSGSGDSGS